MAASPDIDDVAVNESDTKGGVVVDDVGASSDFFPYNSMVTRRFPHRRNWTGLSGVGTKWPPTMVFLKGPIFRSHCRAIFRELPMLVGDDDDDGACETIDPLRPPGPCPPCPPTDEVADEPPIIEADADPDAIADALRAAGLMR